jgi:RimJ/RimL family protein N-acetyltransferase
MVNNYARHRFATIQLSAEEINVWQATISSRQKWLGSQIKTRVTLTKHMLREALPLREGHLTIRECTREDLDMLAAWPNYAFPYQGFEFSFRAMSPSEKDALLQARQGKPNTIVLVANHTEQPTIGYLALTQIDWIEHIVGNFGLRIHPAWCNKGIGTSVLRMVSRWLFRRGIEAVHVDVAASNTRAIRCYEKVGFLKVGETWRDARDLKGIDISTCRYDFLRPHVRLDDEVPKLRFLLMELKPGIPALTHPTSGHA